MPRQSEDTWSMKTTPALKVITRVVKAQVRSALSKDICSTVTVVVVVVFVVEEVVEVVRVVVVVLVSVLVMSSLPTGKNSRT